MSDDTTESSPVLGRNDKCHCDSGKKYKQCHMKADEAARREARAKQAEEAAKAAESEEPRDGQESEARKPKVKHQQTQQSWKRGAQPAGGSQRSLPRKVGN
ncbi:hypothetical protein ABI59_08860 [Acidobacteria bacterium Mor1]|nr:hypothetical protein ABI59_08860 [Acidobacteria bacterium Mor1]